MQFGLRILTMAMRLRQTMSKLILQKQDITLQKNTVTLMDGDNLEIHESA
jgi:hypothetical protein